LNKIKRKVNFDNVQNNSRCREAVNLGTLVLWEGKRKERLSYYSNIGEKKKTSFYDRMPLVADEVGPA
jgi:hypothetical protein